MTDFHSHVLPCMDDGSKSVEESISMLETLYSQGVRTVVATPHFYANRESMDSFLTRRTASYEELSRTMGDDLPQVSVGAEVQFYSGISNLQGLKELCISGTDILLLEMPFTKWTEYTVKEVINISCTKGVTVALAHIDRYLRFQSGDVWHRLLTSGILMQANADFFTSFITRGKALRMLRAGRIHMLGSDCHNMTTRPPNLGDAYNRIVKGLGNDFAESFSEHCQNLLVFN